MWMVWIWLFVSVLVPCIFLLLDTPLTFRIIGWIALAIGFGYLLYHVVSIFLFGDCLRPKAPRKEGPFLQKPLDRIPIHSNDSSSPPNNDSTRIESHTLHPQHSIRHDIRSRCVYILLNSHGQHGARALAMAAEVTKQLTKERDCCLHVIQTAYAGHIEDLGREPLLLPLPDRDTVGCIVIVGGDGSFSEFVNGYMKRCQTYSIPVQDRIPLCLVPAGSGNSLARDLYAANLDVTLPIGAMLDGEVLTIDVSEIEDESHQRFYSTNVISCGLVGETAVVAEDFRSLGDMRYDLIGVWFVLRQVTSTARFVLEGLTGDYNSRRGEELQFTSTPTLSQSFDPICLPPSDADAPYSRSRIDLYGEKTTAFFNQTSHFGKAL